MEHELNFRDSITFLLTSACRPGRRVEMYVAEALSRFFIAFPLYVVWGTGRGCVGVAREVDTPARLMTPAETNLLRDRLPPPSAVRQYEDLIVRVFEGEGSPRAIELADLEPSGGDQLLVVLDSSAAVALDRLQFFKRYLTGQRELYAVVKALHSSARLAEWSGEVERLISDVQTPLAPRLEEASRMIGDMSREPTPELMALIERLAIWAMQQQLGTGWRVRRMEGRSEQLRALCSHVRAAADKWETCSSDGGAVVGTLRCLADMLAAEIERPELREGSAFRRVHGGSDALEQLRTWTLIHELARSLWRGQVSDDDLAFGVWQEVVKHARPALARLLAKSFARANDDAALFRNWLRLWLCHELEWHLGDDELAQRELTSFEPWRWRADLAYVLRESLRLECFGERPDYLVQPDALAESLRTVVEYHAIGIAGMSSAFNVNWILREISEVTRADEYHFMSGHLQHVLEGYIFGHFLCSMVVRETADAQGKSFDGWTIAALLASPGREPDELRARELRQAFSVATLFHDVGMILFPRYIALRESIYDRDEKLVEHLRKIGEMFGGAGAFVSKICIEELENPPKPEKGQKPERVDYFDEAKDAELVRWMDEHKKADRGKPDHALLGAWFLHRLYHRLEGSAEVVRRALRAILLHQVVRQRIDVEDDPVAALLVLCDELFEWDPYMRSVPVHNAMSRTLHMMAVGMDPHPSRARRIRIAGAEAHATGDGNIVVTLPRDRLGSASGWPCIEVELKHPEFLDGKVHHYWLTMAQNLGRVAAHRGWAPEIDMKSPIPPWLEAAGGSKELLRRALSRSTHPIVRGWRNWLASKRFGRNGRVEEVYLGPVGKLFDGDVRDHLGELDRLIEVEMATRTPSIPPQSGGSAGEGTEGDVFDFSPPQSSRVPIG